MDKDKEQRMSANGYFAVIQREKSEQEKQLSWPQFCGNNLKIFNTILTETMDIVEKDALTKLDSNKTQSPDTEVLNNWEVTFFKDSPFAQHLTLKVVHEGFFESKPDVVKISQIDRDNIAAKVALITQTNPHNSEEHCKNACWFVCGNQAIKQEHLQELPREWRHVDGNGLILLDKFAKLDYPKKQILMLMLALAYTQAFEIISEKLAAALSPRHYEGNSLSTMDQVKDIEKLYADAAQFNARYYFFNPVKISNYPTFKCWQDIREAYQLQTQYHELNQQIEQVHDILSYQQKKREDLANERWYKKITIVGLFLSGLGLINVIDILIKNFGIQWGIGLGFLLFLSPFVVYKLIKPKYL